MRQAADPFSDASGRRAAWPGRGRNAFLWVGAVLLWLLGAVQLTPAQAVSDELRLKAAFVYRFPQFVEWPASALEGRSTVDLCVHAPSGLQPALRELAHGEALGPRSLSVRQVRDARSLPGCHVLVVAGAQGDRRAMLRRVADQPVLTVGDSPQFLDEGGIIQLVVRDHRLRFEISAAAASRARLRLSAQLLRLAVAVRGGPS